MKEVSVKELSYLDEISFFTKEGIYCEGTYFSEFSYSNQTFRFFNHITLEREYVKVDEIENLTLIKPYTSIFDD